MIIKREDAIVELKMDSTGLSYSDIAGTQRALSDAFDLYRSMDKTYQSKPRGKDYVFTLNMAAFRKVCSHRGVPEESVFISFLSRIFAANGYTVSQIGFNFDEHGKIADHDTLYISIADYKKGGKVKPLSIPVSKD